MSSRHRVALALLVTSSLAVAGTGTLRADPRWWWNDLQITATAEDGLTPHLTTVSGGTGGPIAGNSAVLVTWAEATPGEADLDVWLTASFNGGCSFCRAQLMRRNDVDDTNPRVAAIVLPNGLLSLAVAYETAGGIEVAWDSSTVDMRQPPATLCSLFERLSGAILSGDQHVQLTAAGVGARDPDISAVATGTVAHFHAAWLDPSTGEDDVFHARDLTGAGGLGWTTTPPKNLTMDIGVPLTVNSPRIACDLLTDPDPGGGGPTMNQSAVNVVFVRQAGIVPQSQLFGLRSTDSGTTFSPSGARADAPSAPVSDATPGLSQPAIAAGFSPFGFTQPAWVATAWNDLRSGVPEQEIRANARRLSAPATPAPDWQVPDEAVSLSGDATEGDPTLAVQFSFNATGAPVYVGWETSLFGPNDLAYRAGVLTPGVPDVIDFSVFPIPRARALDPTVSVDFQLTHCAFDEATFSCSPTRTAGDARDVEFRADGETIYAVWSDSRARNREIFFKRTDRRVTNQAPTLTAACSGIDTAHVDVMFNTVPTCASSNTPERMVRYLVYYGTNVAGPYQNAASPIEVLDDGGLGAVVTVGIDGLMAGQTYFVIVVPEDEARNVFPASFDPTVDGAMRYQTESMILTPSPCALSYTLGCAIVSDTCPTDAGLTGNGSLDFGELLDVDVTLTNTGTSDLTNWSGTLGVTGATVASPAGGLLTLASVPVGESRTVRATLQLPGPMQANCLDPIDFALTAQTSNGGVAYPDDGLAGCDTALGGALGGCGTCAAFPLVAVTRCEIVADSCATGGAGNSDGVVDPGEDVTLEVELTNIGGATAMGLTGRIAVAGGALVTGSPLFGPLSLTAGSSSVVSFTLSATGSCGDSIDIDVLELVSDGGAFLHPDFLDCDHLIGSNPTPVQRVYRDALPFAIPDGGTILNLAGVNPLETPVVVAATVEITGQFPNPANMSARLIGPSAASIDATAALGAPLDVTADYNGLLGGAGHYDIEVSELAPDAAAPSVRSWTLTIDDILADCTPCSGVGTPDVQATCSLVDRCPENAALSGDGQLDFGELIDITIDLQNVGTADAANYAAVLQVAGATVVTPVGGAIVVASIPAGETRQAVVTIQIPRPIDGANCADPVDVDLTMQSADGPVTFPDQELAACDFAIGDPDGACEECAAAAAPCLYRSDVTALQPHTPTRAMVYLVPHDAEDIGLQGPPGPGAYQCPIADGDLEQDANVLTNGIALSIYQVNRFISTLRITKSGTTIRINY